MTSRLVLYIKLSKWPFSLCISSVLGQLYLSQAIPGNFSTFQKLWQLWHSGSIVGYKICEIPSGKVCFYASLSREVPEPSCGACGSKTLPTVEEDQIRDSLSKLDLYKSTAPAGQCHCKAFSHQSWMVMAVGSVADDGVARGRWKDTWSMWPQRRGRRNCACSALRKDDWGKTLRCVQLPDQKMLRKWRQSPLRCAVEGRKAAETVYKKKILIRY